MCEYYIKNTCAACWVVCVIDFINKHGCHIEETSHEEGTVNGYIANWLWIWWFNIGWRVSHRVSVVNWVKIDGIIACLIGLKLDRSLCGGILPSPWHVWWVIEYIAWPLNALISCSGTIDYVILVFRANIKSSPSAALSWCVAIVINIAVSGSIKNSEVSVHTLECERYIGVNWLILSSAINNRWFVNS